MEKQLVSILCVKVLRVLMRCLYVLRIKKNRLLFCSFTGNQYACNPKYLSEYITSKFGNDYDIVWVFSKKSRDNNEYKGKRCTYKSLKHFYYIFTSRVIVINNSNLHLYIPIRKQQILINLWHGGGATKKIGNDVKQQSNDMDTYLRKLAAANTSYFVSSSEYFTRVTSKAMFIDKVKFIPTGMPRNDILFDDIRVNLNRKKVLDYYKLSCDVGIILYAPTFRDYPDCSNEDNAEELTIDTHRILSTAFRKWGKKFVLIYRAHHLMQPSKFDDEQINGSLYPDMQELLCAADCIITDYSSSTWDYQILKRPIFIFAPDIVSYADTTGFYIDIREQPYIMAISNDELIKNIEEYAEKEEQDRITEYINKLHTYEKGNACEDICKLLFNK